MRKFLSRLTAMLMAVIAWVSAAPDANAWTARELRQAYDFGVEQVSGQANQNAWLITSGKVSFSLATANDGTELLCIKNFLGKFKIYLTVSGNTVKAYGIDELNFPLTDGGSMNMGGTTINNITLARVSRGYGFKSSSTSYYYTSVYYDEQYNGKWSYVINDAARNAYTDWTGTITTDETGNPVIDFGSYVNWRNNGAIMVKYCYSNGYSNYQRGYDIFERYRITLFNNTGSFEDSLNGKYDAAAYTGEEGKTIGFLNFTNWGYPWNNGVEYDGTTYSDYQLVTGYIDGNKFIIPRQMIMATVSGTALNGTLNNVNYDLFGFNPETQQHNPDDAITGTIKFGSLNHETDNYWVHTVNGGDMHTYLKGCHIKLDPYGIIGDDGNMTPWEKRVHDAEIDFPGYLCDITFDCDLQVTLGDTYYDNGKDYVKAEFALTEKDGFCSDYTTHYDVYYLEGEYTHAANVPVEQAKKIQTVVFDDNKKTYTFSYDLPYPEGYEPTENPTESQKYTFFVVAHYNAAEMADAQVKAATNGSAAHLEATYHALTTVGKPLPTALNGLAVAEAQIKVVSGAVVVEGFDGVVEVYNAQGACVYTGTDSRIELNGGVYIVRAGTKAVKVVIG